MHWSVHMLVYVGACVRVFMCTFQCGIVNKIICTDWRHLMLDQYCQTILVSCWCSVNDKHSDADRLSEDSVVITLTRCSTSWHNANVFLLITGTVSGDGFWPGEEVSLALRLQTTGHSGHMWWEQKPINPSVIRWSQIFVWRGFVASSTCCVTYSSQRHQ